jgi:DNA-binding transcriptional ArsR family regulator
MLAIKFDTEALTRVRFAISPMLELARSITALDDPAGQALHLPWAEQTRPSIAGLDLTPLRALQTSPNYNPDFVNPPPSGPLAELEDELAVMLATPTSQIRAEVEVAYAGARLPEVLEPFVSKPRRAIEQLADLMRAYWDAALAEHWPRIHSLLEQDVLHRARQMADGGTSKLFADLDESVRWRDGILRLEACEKTDTEVELDDRGLLMTPSVYVWPKVTMVTAPPWQPTVIYPARGVGLLWSPERPAPPDALAKLIGGLRAEVLMELDCPRSTTELAGALGITTGGVSQHLGVLHDAGLVSRRRVSRFVLYLRSPEGDALVASAGA